MFDKLKKNKQKEERELDRLHKERLERCIPVAKDILRLLAQNIDVMPLGDDVQESAEYDRVACEMLALILKANLYWHDRDFILQLALQPLSFTKDIVSNSMQTSWSKAIAGLFKKPSSRLLMSDVNEALQNGEPIEAAQEVADAAAAEAAVEQAVEVVAEPIAEVAPEAAAEVAPTEQASV